MLSSEVDCKTCREIAELEHDPEKWTPVFPRDKREAFARRPCLNNKIERDGDSKKNHPAQREDYLSRQHPVHDTVAVYKQMGQRRHDVQPDQD